MGFPENVLTRDERVVRSLHPHWLTVLGAFVLLVVLAVLAGVAVWATPETSTGAIVQWVCLGVAVVLAVPMFVAPVLRWRTTHYVITTHRVMVRRGILSKSGKDITLSKITDVSFHQSLLDRVLGAGTLSIESAGDSADEDLRNIPHSDEVQQLINHLIDEDATRRQQRLLGEPPTEPRPARPELAEE